MSKVLVAMSGGVDSSVCALMLRDAGYECVGATMRLVTNASIGICGESICCSTADVLDACTVCDKLGIRHVTFDLDEEFIETVIQPFSDAYAAGLTPNPCVWCNRYLKFDLLWRFAQQMGCDSIATGHYARVEQNAATGLFELKRACNEDKDQSYVLYPIRQEVLAHTLLPLSIFASKAEVRAAADAHGFVTARKHESEDICFVPDGDYPGFLERFRGERLKPGAIVDADGITLGAHDGIERFTIGQRKGLGIALGERRYVIDKDARTGEVRIGSEEDLLTSRFEVGEANWLDGYAPDIAFEADVVIRYNGERHPACITPLDGNRFMVESTCPIRAVAPGQSAVVYLEDKVVCGGIIERAERKTDASRM